MPAWQKAQEEEPLAGIIQRAEASGPREVATTGKCSSVPRSGCHSPFPSVNVTQCCSKDDTLTFTRGPGLVLPEDMDGRCSSCWGWCCIGGCP